MRLLHVTQRYLPAIGGAEKYIADLSEELVRRGHKVDVFTSRALDFHTWKNVLPRFERLGGVDVFRFRSMRRRRWVWNVLHFGLRNYWRSRSRAYEPFIFFGGGPLSPGMLRAMLAKGRRYDLIHLNCMVYGHVAYGYWAARRLDVPVVITPHAHIEHEETYALGYQQEAMAGSDHVLAGTVAERETLVNLGLEPYRVSVSGHGLAVEEYKPGLELERAEARRRLGLPVEGFMVLFLGRKSDYKGLDVALDAHAALSQHVPELHFMAVGPETDFSRSIWGRYQGLPRLHVMDAVPHEEKLAALRASDCLVLPSTGEAFGIVFLEAWIMGRPVVGARTPSVSSVINQGVDGLLSTPGDAGDLAACISRLASDPMLAQQMGAAGHDKVVTRYTVPRVADRVEGAYLRVLRRRQRARERVQ
jgi:glycosyltransferase involved in cell wall biosynthesis